MRSTRRIWPSVEGTQTAANHRLEKIDFPVVQPWESFFQTERTSMKSNLANATRALECRSRSLRIGILVGLFSLGEGAATAQVVLAHGGALTGNL
jgi:hypothetical protein